MEFDGSVRYVRITDIDDDGKLKKTGAVSPSTVEPRYFLRKGDLLFARSGSVGRCYLHQLEEGKYQFAGYLIRYRTLSSIVLPAYVFYITRSSYWRKWIKTQSKTATLANINATQFSSFQIPLPSLSDQRRIVAVLDGKMAAVEQARTAALERVEAVQALPAAFLREVFCFGDGELPQRWWWTRLGDVCEVQKGITPRIAWYADSGIRIIKFRDIANGKINWTPGFRSFVRSEYESRLRQLKVGMTLIGADAHNPEYIGKKVSFTDSIPQEPVFFSGELITITPKADCPIAARWPFLWFSSCMGYKAVQEKVVGVHLNSSPAKNIKIPLPPLAKQQRIMAALNKKTAAADKARIAAEAELEVINALPAAFLRQAFDGAL